MNVTQGLNPGINRWVNTPMHIFVQVDRYAELLRKKVSDVKVARGASGA